MMRPLTLATKFNLLMAGAFSTIFLVNILTLADRVRAGFEAEMKSNLKLARELAVMEAVNGGDPVARLRQVFDDSDYRQRVDFRIFWNAPRGRVDPETAPAPQKALESPSWFSALVSPKPETIRIPVTVEGMMKFGVIELTFHPDLEAGKAWSSLTRLALSNFGALGAILVAVLFFMHRWLYPFKPLGETLLSLERGATQARMPQQGAAEFRDIAVKLNSLAATLDHMEKENRTLIEQLVRMQDDERARIARDLHDDVAPCLFAIRTGLLALSQSRRAEAAQIDKIVDDIAAAGSALQQIVRRLLDELRPPGLFEMGLEPALRSLLANWRATRPDVAIDLEAPHDLGALDEAVAITAYRIVQEALTNIYRHSSARNATVALKFEAAAPDEDNATLMLHVAVSDDGVGVREGPQKGRGLIGMAERVKALQGRLDIRERAGGGTVVDAALPLPPAKPE